VSNLLKNYARFDLEFVRGEGATLFDKDGRDYIDFGSGIGVVSLGHGNSELAETIGEQVKTLLHTSNLYGNSLQEELAKRVSNLAGFQLYSFFSNSGAEANEGAIKIARKYGKGERFEIISIKDSFHGRTLGSLSATGQPSLQNSFLPMVEGFRFVENIDEVEKNISPKTVAVILELVRGEGGVEALPVEKVQKLVESLKSRDILLIVDEIQSGIYRTGEFLASNIYGIEPDIVTLAKGIASGVPIGVVATKLEDGFSAGDHGSTFGGNYLSSASALKTLEILEREKEKIRKNGELFSNEIDQLLNDFPDIFSHSTGVGLMRGLVLKEGDVGELVKKCNSHRVLTLKSGNNTLRLLPPLLICENEIKEGFERLKRVLES
jgi:acetylornithine/N-succinyldiaminopimelate aminotransferase